MYINYCHFVRFMNLFLIRVLELFVYSPCSLVYVLCSLCIKACSEDSGHKFLKFVFIIGFFISPSINTSNCRIQYYMVFNNNLYSFITCITPAQTLLVFKVFIGKPTCILIWPPLYVIWFSTHYLCSSYLVFLVSCAKTYLFYYSFLLVFCMTLALHQGQLAWD